MSRVKLCWESVSGLAHDMHYDKAIIWLSVSVVSEIPAALRLVLHPHQQLRDMLLMSVISVAFNSAVFTPQLLE